MLSQKLKIEKGNTPNQDEFRAVHLNYKSIKIIDKFAPEFSFIEELYLNHNNLLSLSGIEAFKNLRIFHFRFNRVQNFSELYKIENPFFLESLAVFGNPLELDQKSNYGYLKQHIFKNIKEYNPSCLDYYQKLEQTQQPPPIKVNLKELSFSTPPSLKKYSNLNNTFTANFKTITPSTTQDIHYISKNPFLSIKQQRNNINSKKQTNQTFSGYSPSDNNHLKNPLLKSPPVKINPFIKNIQEEQREYLHHSAKTAKFTIDKMEQYQFSKTKRVPKIINKFIDEQNQYLADSFYYRTLYYKSLLVLKGASYVKAEKFYNCNLILKGYKILKQNYVVSKIQRQYASKKHSLLKLSSSPITTQQDEHLQ